MANMANMFALLDEDAPKAAPAKENKPAAAAAPAKKAPAKTGDKPAGNRNNGNAKRAPRAPREFEGSVEGTEGGRSRPRNADRRKPKDGEGGRRDRADRSGRGHEGPHRGGAGKGGWGKPGDELNAPKEGDDAEPEPEPEEPDNEISIEDFEAAKAAKKAALNAAMAKGATAKEVDSSAFASMTLAAKSEDVNEFSLDGAGPKAKRERERKAKEAAKLELGFKSAPTAPAEDRPARGAGGRGGRGDGRGAGRGRGAAGGRGGRGGDRPAGGRGGSGLNVKIEDASAFPTLGK